MEYLYLEVFPKVKSYILKNSGSEDDAFDIFQDGIVALCKQIKSGKFDRKHEIAAFLYVVCRNFWTNKVKRDKKVPVLPDNIEVADNYDFTEDIVTDQKKQVLEEIKIKLGKKCFELLQYSMFFKLKPQEIIEKMGFSTVNAVKTQKYKCKQKLTKLIEENKRYREIIE